MNQALRSGIPVTPSRFDIGVPSPPKTPRVEPVVPMGVFLRQGVEEAYEFLELLERGGQAEVWKARRRADGLLIALKIPIGARGMVMTLEQGVYEAFGNEVRLWQALKHPHIVRCMKQAMSRIRGSLWNSWLEATCAGAYARGLCTLLRLSTWLSAC